MLSVVDGITKGHINDFVVKHLFLSHWHSQHKIILTFDISASTAVAIPRNLALKFVLSNDRVSEFAEVVVEFRKQAHQKLAYRKSTSSAMVS